MTFGRQSRVWRLHGPEWKYSESWRALPIPDPEQIALEWRVYWLLCNRSCRRLGLRNFPALSAVTYLTGNRFFVINALVDRLGFDASNFAEWNRLISAPDDSEAPDTFRAGSIRSPQQDVDRHILICKVNMQEARRITERR